MPKVLQPIREWAASLDLAAGTVATVRQRLGQVLTAAVEDGLIARNPAAGARMPKNETPRPMPVPLEVIEAIAAALPSWARVAVPLGLGRSNRSIPLATFVGDQLAAHIAEHGTGDHGLILHLPDGRPIGRNRIGRIWRAARKTAGAEHVDYHDLRHTFASTLLSEGVSVRAVADWMGHASPMVTLNTYAHMMPVDEDRGRSVLDSVLGANRAESWLSPGVSQPNA